MAEDMKIYEQATRGTKILIHLCFSHCFSEFRIQTFRTPNPKTLITDWLVAQIDGYLWFVIFFRVRFTEIQNAA